MIQILIFALLSAQSYADCKLFYASKTDLHAVKVRNEDVRTLSRGINNALRTSFDFLNKIDHYTLGLASAALLGGHTLEDIKPVEWDRFVVAGRLIHQNSPFDAVPLRGATLTFQHEDKSDQISTGVNGEFTQSFHKIVSYKRLLLFPQPTLVFAEKYVRTAKIPVTVKLESKVCKAETRLMEIPFEPIIFIATDN